jgi:alkylation response protein AidB-like acyl-CoA dehydrogenase
MALTEPQGGSSLSDVKTTATPTGDGHHLIRGTKIFISGGDHDLTDNIVNMVLARDRRRPGRASRASRSSSCRAAAPRAALVPNDVETAGVIHKIGWRGLPERDPQLRRGRRLPRVARRRAAQGHSATCSR